jgi:hypothetical protein
VSVTGRSVAELSQMEFALSDYRIDGCLVFSFRDAIQICQCAIVDIFILATVVYQKLEVKT